MGISLHHSNKSVFGGSGLVLVVVVSFFFFFNKDMVIPWLWPKLLE